MEKVSCSFCGHSGSQIKYRVKAEKYHPGYLATINIIGPVPPDEFTVVSCHSCKLLYLNPRYDADELSRVYPDEQYTSRVGYLSGSILFKRSGKVPNVAMRGDAVDSPRNKERLAGIKRYNKSGRALDIGCNNGSFLALLDREGWEAYGVDFSQTAINNAKNVFGQERAFCGELAEAGYPDGFFDVVTMYNTIEHLPNPGEVLQEIKRICKPSALIVIQTIDFDSLNARLIPRSLIFPAQHLYYFRSRDLRNHLQGLGFSFVAARYDGNSVLRFAFYMAMHWWTLAMVAAHRTERGWVAESCRYLLEKFGVIFDEKEMLQRMGMVGASNMPAIRADRTFYFINKDTDTDENAMELKSHGMVAS
jgi:2-polyprenyl-3-methyl-5-hydroxy-6-metoxy-1,4-benzoquinol methylase